MNINPLDIIVTRSNEVLHVQEVISGDGSHDEEMVIKVKDHGGRSFTRTVTNPEREIRKCGSNVSVLDAEDYYDRERFMDTLVTESRSKDFKALHNYYYNYSSLVYCPSLLTDNSLSARSMYEYLDAAERDISEAISWMKDTRDEYLTKTTEISELADKAPTYTEPTLTGEAVSLYDVKFKVGGIYRYQFNPEKAVIGYKYGYARVTAVSGTRVYVTLPDGREGHFESTRYHYALTLTVDTRTFHIYTHSVKLLPIGSFRDIQQYVTHEGMTSAFLEKVFENTYLDMFSAGEGKPLCLPSKWELEGTLGDYLNAERCRAHIMKRINEMTLDMRKSVSHVQWVRSELKNFYAGI